MSIDNGVQEDSAPQTNEEATVTSGGDNSLTMSVDLKDDQEPQTEAPLKISGKEIMMERAKFDELPAGAVDTSTGALILKETGDSIRLI